jgi:DNA-directed RNA polymerase subunit K/omega
MESHKKKQVKPFAENESENEEEDDFDDIEEDEYRQSYHVLNPKKKKDSAANTLDFDIDNLEETSVNSEEADEDEEADEEAEIDIENADFDTAAIMGDASQIHTKLGIDDISDADEDEDEDYDENYLQKFDDTLKRDIIDEYHPEMVAHNNDEIDVLTRIVRDNSGKIIDPLHKTMPFITKYERSRILGERAKQINAGAKIFVDVEPTVIDGYLIAIKEFDERKIPFIIKRPLPNGGSEYWKFKDLEIL